MEGSAESVRRDHDGVVIAHHHDDHANGDTDDHHDDHAFSKYHDGVNILITSIKLLTFMITPRS